MRMKGAQSQDLRFVVPKSPERPSLPFAPPFISPSPQKQVDAEFKPSTTKWTNIAKFILNQPTPSFRKNLSQINNKFYEDVKEIAYEIIKNSPVKTRRK